MNIEIPIDNLLSRQGHSFYWLAKETGVSYSTLWRLKKGRSLGVNFNTLVKICEALDCTPGDLLTLASPDTEPLPSITLDK
jgi:putative transcriptional regulator